MGGLFQTSGSNAVILRKRNDGFLAGRFCSSLSVDFGWLFCRIISTAVKNFRVETTNGSKLFLDVFSCLSANVFFFSLFWTQSFLAFYVRMTFNSNNKQKHNEKCFQLEEDKQI